MNEEQIKSIVGNIAHGIALFNDIGEIKKQATSSGSESSPKSAAGPPEHVSLWAAVRDSERETSTPTTLDKLEDRPPSFVEAQRNVPDVCSELEVTFGSGDAVVGDVADGAGSARDAADDLAACWRCCGR
mmetsp:Transcript_22258/g.58127  ORF Transcript_22258/g.58127 Transcript_22258/m.58127 type:complete len:130 (+) Transcript_22258:386-775(+)